MNTPLRTLALLAILTVAGSATTARADVSAEVDWQGNYVRMVVVSQFSVTGIKLWTPTLPSWGPYRPLNPDGDRNGDLWPVMREDPLGGVRPWIVWGRFTGSDYDLAWSRWSGSGWTPIRWLESAPRPGADLDPDLTLDKSGRPYVAWWSDEDGLGRVYFSMYLDTQWMGAYLVSDPEIDSRDPIVTVGDDGTITVSYLTPRGRESRTVRLIRGHSINDDFDPINSVTVTTTDKQTGR
jgi:hypothetical protein